MMMALMAVVATTAFAQDEVVKNAKKLFSKGDYNGAVEMLKPALTSAETLDKAAAWNLLTDIYYDQYSKQADAAVKSMVPGAKEKADSAVMFSSAVKAWEAAIETDKYDQLPDAKGKVKRKFLSANQNRFKPMAITFVQGGQYYYSNKNNEEAIRLWKTYVNMRETSLFKDVPEADFPKESFYNDIVYYCALLSYQMKNYDDAGIYAKKMVEADPSKADEANEIMLFSKKETMTTKADSLEYLNMLKGFHKENPTEERYFNLLMEYYTRSNDMKALNDWANEETEINPENKMAWALKGEALMNNRDWDPAVEAYKKAIEIDPSFIQCIFNAGVCLNGKAIDLKDKLADKNTGGLTKENAEKVKSILAEALSFLERSKELDPDREKVNWAYPLYQIYYSLGDKAKSDEMEKLVNAGN
jgi:tetratricopeptide (TPR) repeat protein